MSEKEKNNGPDVFDRIAAYNDPDNGTIAERLISMLEKPIEWPTIRVAHKDGEFFILWPGELSTPYKRGDWEVMEYAPRRELAEGKP